MERLSIDEIIAHCKRNVEKNEKTMSREQFETGNMDSCFMKEYCEHRQVAEWLEQLKAYRDAEEQGLLRKFPVAIGSAVYRINKGARNPIIPLVVTELRFKALRSGKTITKIMCSDDVAVKTDGCSVYYEEEIGKKIFLTKEEAEQALAEMKGV